MARCRRNDDRGRGGQPRIDCSVASSTDNGLGNTTAPVAMMRMNASKATHANATASVPASDASSHDSACAR